MFLYRIDIEFLGTKTPKTLTEGNLKKILFHLNKFKEHRCGIKFKSSFDLDACKDYIKEYVESNSNLKVEMNVIRGNVLYITGSEEVSNN